MAEKHDEIEIELDKPDETGSKTAEIAVPVDEKTIITPEQGIEELRAQLESEKRGRQEALNRAQQAENQVQVAKSETDDTNLRMITNAIGVVKNNQLILEQHYAAAMTTQDYAQAAKVQTQMAKAVLELSKLEEGEKEYKNRQQAPKRPISNDPVETYAAQLPPRSAAWIRSHPEYARDPKLTRRMIRAHEDAVDDGISPDTDEYFRAVEDRLGLGGQEEITVEEPPAQRAAQVVQRRVSPASAPVTRASTNMANGKRSITMTLSEPEREQALLDNPGMPRLQAEQEYAKNKYALIKAGRMKG